MKYDNVLIDMLNLYYRASWVKEEKVVEFNNRKYLTHGITGTMDMIDRIMNKYLEKGGKVFCLFDNAKTVINRRKDIDAMYKSDRKKMSDAFYRGFNYIELILRNYNDNILITREKFLEADDWTLPILNSVTGKSLLVSTDLDWARMLSDNVHWLSGKNMYDPEKFKDNFGYYPTIQSVCFNKVFYGDKVDDISPALKQLPFDFFLKIANTYSDIYEFVQDVTNEKIEYLDSGWIKRILRDRDLLFRNWKLVSFAPLDETDIKRYTIVGKYNSIKLSLLYESLKLEKIERIKDSEENVIDFIESNKLNR